MKKEKNLLQVLEFHLEELNKRADALHENNPMMGHRGVRLGITYPEITEMQVRAIFEAYSRIIKGRKETFSGNNDSCYLSRK